MLGRLTSVSPASEQKAPARCTRCDGSAIVPIVYGLPGGALIDAAGRGEILLGGCIVGPQEWACLDCGYAWPLPPEALESSIVCNALYLVHRAQPDEGRIKHAIAVGHLLFESGYEPYVIAAGLLHETIASGAVSAAQIADEAGSPAAALVEAITERADIPNSERRSLELRARIAGAGGRAAALYAADRLSTVRTLSCSRARNRLNGSLAAELWNLERDLRMLTRVGSLPFVDDLEAELASVA
jgi:hypothetical protein